MGKRTIHTFYLWKKCAQYRRQDFTIIALDVRVERLDQSQQRPRESAVVPGRLRFTIYTRPGRWQSGHQLAHLLTFDLQSIEQCT
jgi:hypothetical protein